MKQNHVNPAKQAARDAKQAVLIDSHNTVAHRQLDAVIDTVKNNFEPGDINPKVIVEIAGVQVSFKVQMSTVRNVVEQVKNGGMF